MSKEEHHVDFLRWRRVRQRQKERQFYRLLDDVLTFAEKRTLMREKVRARHIFQQLTGQKPDQPGALSGLAEQVFRIWYALDYINIRHRRLIQEFLDAGGETWLDKKSRLIWASTLIASFYSIFFLTRSGEDWILKEMASDLPPLTADPRYWPTEGWQEGASVMARPVKVGVHYLPIGPIRMMSPEETDDVRRWLERVYATKKLDQPHLPWRVFMQRHGLGWLSQLESGGSVES
ncbi:hypothetical protein [Polycladomyces subterraneus]|uniref:Uncharacterized protein n=1 Tax=Polycladomyces subterraneus TaxID=1016997 RepID=A0ABT8IS50_9BACL|nr:hypothetical protein [Polycladomyces subterraneus]MDN4594899.1 hypothetical protein [Polycladomyces subterraneus]